MKKYLLLITLFSQAMAFEFPKYKAVSNFYDKTGLACVSNFHDKKVSHINSQEEISKMFEGEDYKDCNLENHQ